MTQLSDISVQFIKGVGPARKKLLENLGVSTVEDLFYLFPRRYEDRTTLTPLSQLKEGEQQTVTGRVVARGARQSWYTRKHVYETVIDDGTGRMFAVWFNQPYLDRYFQPGAEVVFYGRVEVYKNRLQMISPEYEIIERDDQNLNTGRIVPIYPLTRGMTQRYLRKIIRATLDRYREELYDTLPVAVRNKHRFINIRRSIENIHFPQSAALQDEAQRRISFEEFFLFQLSVIKRRMSIVRCDGIAHAITAETIRQFAALFPFSLTEAQRRVMGEIASDMRNPSPMLRLLQGDVGSGKTLAAMFGCLAAFKNGAQSAFMVPTEILARQHYRNFVKIFSDGGAPLKIALLISGLPKSERDAILTGLKDGTIDLVVGTHAVLGEQVYFKNLSYAVIDEQHKFGVRQRALLSSKGNLSAGGTGNPDVLVMTATPIPRTLSLTLFGDLDLSVIDAMPPGRGKIKTRVFKTETAAEVYALVRKAVEAGQQAYVIYPIIEESETLDLKAAEAMFRHFQKNEFKGLSLGLVHGQMKRNESEEIMTKFKNNEIHILVATSVVEVGVDVPNATVMVIEHADRFGLSQLHQLRGRIGRGKENGLCLLIADPVTGEAGARLKAIVATTDGFKIAEKDLEIRGPGQYFGRHQHGLNELRFADPVTQIDILQLARQEATELIQRDPDMTGPQHGILRELIQKRYPDYLNLAMSG